VFLWSQNLGETWPGDVVAPLAFLVAAAGVVTWLAGRLVGDARRAALVVTPAILGLLLYGHVATILRPLDVRVAIQQVGWVALVFVAAVAAVRLPPARIEAIDRLLTSVGVVLVVVTFVAIVPSEIGSAGHRAPAPGGRSPATHTDAPRRDVYHLVFDRYGSDRSLMLAYGLRNDLTPWLRERGFTVLADSHANYVRTGLSLSTTLGMQHLGDLLPDQPPASSDLRPIYEAMDGPFVARQFQALGYRHVHVGSGWEPERQDPTADVNFVMPGPSDFESALYDASAAPALLRRLGLSRASSSARDAHVADTSFSLDTLDTVDAERGPKFVFAHVLLPHPPYVYDRDGRVMTGAETAALSVPERFERQVGYTNSRIRALVDRLLAAPEERRPIILVQADEGPWPRAYAANIRGYDWSTASPDDLEIKFGILNAWYVPGEADLDLDPAMTAINTYPVLFGRYFGLDHPLLPERIHASRDWYHPYDLTDVTDRLPRDRPSVGRLSGRESAKTDRGGEGHG
jgi:hypothetical protein